MLRITCKICGTQTTWDDYKPAQIKCPRCGEKLNIHRALRDNIEYREQVEAARFKHCPFCNEIVSRLWFIRCSGCRRWIFGRRAISGKWFAAIALVIAYLAISTMYFMYFY